MNSAALVVMMLIVILGWLSTNTTMSGYKFFRLILTIFLSIVSALNAPVTYDHDVYALAYERAYSFDFISYIAYSLLEGETSGYEPGYAILNWVFSHMGVKEAMFFFIISLFVNDSILRFIYQYKYSFFILLWVYMGGNILIQQQNLVRQFIAVGIFLYALSNLKEGNRVNYVLLVLLSSLFHYSAIINIIFIPLYSLVQSRKGNKILLSVITLLYGFSVLSIIFPQILNIIIGINGFYGYSFSSESDVGMQVIMLYLLLYNIFSIFAICNWKKVNWILAIGMIILAIINNISMSIPNLLRLIYYYTILASVFMFHSLYSYHGTNKTILTQNKQLILTFSILYFIWNIFVNFILQKGLLFSKMYYFADFY